MGIKIVHIEAGLRQKPKSMPEKINRIIVNQTSNFLFPLTEITVENLKNEGINKNVYKEYFQF